MPSALGDKIRALRKDKGLSLEQLGEQTHSSKSYLWELENKDDPKPSAEKLGKIAAVLGVTADYFLNDTMTTPGQAEIDKAFFRRYVAMDEPDKKRLRQILDAWEDN